MDNVISIEDRNIRTRDSHTTIALESATAKRMKLFPSKYIPKNNFPPHVSEPSRSALRQTTLCLQSSVSRKKPTSNSIPVPTPAPSQSALFSLLKDPDWKDALGSEFIKPYFTHLESALTRLWGQSTVVYPPRSQIFAAFNATPLNRLRVVLIGQDPYHGPNQAHGLCFSVSPGVPPPPSLLNMYKELERDIPGFVTPSHGTLLSWAHQGVLMLNATLTVEAHKANSHSGMGWQTFTDAVIDYVNRKKKSVVFLLWGNFAQKKAKSIDSRRHRVVACAHPSPLSVTKWRGCRTFSQCNSALLDMGAKEIDWRLPLTIEEELWRQEKCAI